MHLPVALKEIQAEYLISPYLYLAQNKLPSTKTAIHKVEALAEKYMKIINNSFEHSYMTEKGECLQWESNLMPLICQMSTLDH